MSPLKSVSKKSVTPVKYLIIGNSAAGVAAVEAIRQYDKTGSLAVVSDEPWHTYSRPLISYLLEGKTTQEKMRYRGDSFYQTYSVETHLGVRAEKLDTKKRTVALSDGSVLEYQKLLLATGSVPFVPPMNGCPAPNTGKGVYTFIKLADALALQETVTATTQVVVVGGGLTGVKATEGLLHLTKNISRTATLQLISATGFMRTVITMLCETTCICIILIRSPRKTWRHWSRGRRTDRRSSAHSRLFILCATEMTLSTTNI